jgi:hypothetical protein
MMTVLGQCSFTFALNRQVATKSGIERFKTLNLTDSTRYKVLMTL